jgi:hypothetical protein
MRLDDRYPRSCLRREGRAIPAIKFWRSGVHVLPKYPDDKVARLQLKKLSAELTVLTDRQACYIGVDQAGPYKADHYRY